MATKKKTGQGESVTFQSIRFAEHRIVLDPRTMKEVNGRVLAVSLDKLHPAYPNGLTVEFKNHLFTTSDPIIIEALKEHADYGMMFVALEEGKTELTPEAARKINERRGAAAQAASTDPNQCTVEGCGYVAKNKRDLGLHMKSHEGQ